MPNPDCLPPSPAGLQLATPTPANWPRPRMFLSAPYPANWPCIQKCCSLAPTPLLTFCRQKCYCRAPSPVNCLTKMFAAWRLPPPTAYGQKCCCLAPIPVNWLRPKRLLSGSYPFPHQEVGSGVIGTNNKINPASALNWMYWLPSLDIFIWQAGQPVLHSC